MRKKIIRFKVAAYNLIFRTQLSNGKSLSMVSNLLATN